MNDKKLILSGAVLIVIGLVIGYLIWGGNRNLGGTTAATWTAANLVSNGTLDVTGATTLTGVLTAATSSLGGVGNNVTVASTTNAYNIGLILKGSGLQMKASDSTTCYKLYLTEGGHIATSTQACQ